jgi:hypothetical protein
MSDVLFLLIGVGIGLFMRLILAFIDVSIKEIEKK